MQIKLVRISGFNHYTVSVNADLFWPYMILQDIKSTVLSWQLEVARRRDLHSHEEHMRRSIKQKLLNGSIQFNVLLIMQACVVCCTLKQNMLSITHTQNSDTKGDIQRNVHAARFHTNATIRAIQTTHAPYSMIALCEEQETNQ